ncbi:hypothetical protein SBADM41S_07362 [Streptomyces badius]
MLARRGFLGSSLALAAGPALIEPMQRWLVPVPVQGTGEPEAPAADHRPSRLSPPELDLLESTTAMFRQWDAQCGGGLRRKAVVGQLHEVTDLLQEPQPGPTAQRLFRCAAELAELAGWMSYDVGLQPTAQKYFVLALHAAKEAGDKPLGSYILSSMSRQMIHLGRPDDALELIHLAQYGSRDCATSRTQAMLYAMEARAYANMGQPSKCKRAVRMAEDTFLDAGLDGEPEPDWIRFFSEAELNGENTHSYRDLDYVASRSPTYASLAEPVMEKAVELFGEDDEHQRSYALNLIGMATVHLLPARTGAVHRARRTGPQDRQEGPLRAGQHPPAQDQSTPLPGTSAMSPTSPGSPICSTNSSRRPPKRSDPASQAPAAAPLPYTPTRLPHRLVTRRVAVAGFVLSGPKGRPPGVSTAPYAACAAG